MMSLLISTYVYSHCINPNTIPFDRTRITIHESLAIEKETKEENGRASWYDYEYRGVPVSKTKLVAASRTLPRGTRAIVTNQENGKQVIVKITDYGPDVKVHPDRVIDLGSLAFSKIASLNQGVINVKVQIYE